MADQELVTVTIDGMQIAVPKGTSIIEAAKQAGILVPHYCYHPSLPSPAVCRMCLVEVEKAPKLMPACVTTVAEGQVVHVDTRTRRRRGRACWSSSDQSSARLPDLRPGRRVRASGLHVPGGPGRHPLRGVRQAVQPGGGLRADILYVPNRCILCTRCVRFMEDVAETPVLNVSERGDRAYIGIAEEQRLDHAWSGNVVDLCPVGSLLSKDFLHKARAWDLDKSASVCPGCTQGCNISIDTRDEVVVRIRPGRISR